MGSSWEVHGTEKALKSMVEYDKIDTVHGSWVSGVKIPYDSVVSED